MCTCCMLVTEVACSDAIRQARVTRVQSRGLKMLETGEFEKKRKWYPHCLQEVWSVDSCEDINN